MTALAPGLRRAEWPAAVLGVALAAAVLRAPVSGPMPLILTAGATAPLVAWIVLQDLVTFTISDAAVLALAALACAFRLKSAVLDGAPAGGTALAAAIDVVLCGGALLLFREGYYRLKGTDGLGLGDVKLAAAGALLVGTAGFAWALFAASAAGLAAVAVAQFAGRTRPERLAFGAVLAPAIWGVWLLEQALPRLEGI